MEDYDKLFRTTDEQIFPLEAHVSGRVPDWLEGTLLRNSPAVFQLDSGFTMNHLFDGFAVICKFTIQREKVTFSKRWLQSISLRAALKTGKPTSTEFGTRAYSDLNNGPLSVVMNNLLPTVPDNHNLNIIKLGTKYYAVSWFHKMSEIDPRDLSVVNQEMLYREVGITCISPCVLSDMQGHSYSVCLDLDRVLLGKPHQYPVVELLGKSKLASSDDKHARLLGMFRSGWDSLISFQRSFALTDDFVVFIEQPCVAKSSDAFAREQKGLSYYDMIQWRPELKNRFCLLKKATGEEIAVEYESKQPFFFLHIINAYQHNQQLVVDVIGYDNCDVLEKLLIQNLRKGKFQVDNLQTRRFILPVVKSVNSLEEGVNLIKDTKCSAMRRGNVIQLEHAVICYHAHEFPSINGDYTGKPYRYYYATGFMFSSKFDSSVLKVDCESGDVIKWFAGNGQIPSQATFVARPDGTAEDDGVLLVCVTSALPHHQDRLVILDATDLQLVATATIPSHVPFTFYGIFAIDECFD